MKDITRVITEYWPLITIVLSVLISAFNGATKHWSNHKGAMKALTFVSEILSFIRSIDVPSGLAGRAKMPLTDAKPEGKTHD